MDITRSPAWQTLAGHATRLQPKHLRELFAADSRRSEQLGFETGDLLVDFSKQRIDAGVLAALVALAEQAEIAKWREAMFSGETINRSEGRAVLHTALRAAGGPFPRADFDVMPAVGETRQRMAEFAEAVRDGRHLGYTGLPIRAVVNIGIGGSDLGPKMATRALRSIAHPTLAVHYISNVDGAHLAPLLQTLDPRTTLFIVASKTFTTQETLLNATTARNWLVANLGAPEAVGRHFVGVTAQPPRAEAFGIAPGLIFPFWDWVGGRFSLWSAVGLPLMIAIGPQAFDEFLAGAHAMDTHFCTAPLERNLPVLMGLIEIWNTDFLGAETSAVLPYNESLRYLPAYLQQLEMESNGKTVDRDGRSLNCRSMPIVWGEIGINGQHAFFQLLHQGGRLVPCDFIASARSDYPLPGHHEALLANCFAQSAALAFGKTEDEARAELQAAGTLNAQQVAELLPNKVFPGNLPSTTILLPRLGAREIGQLIALYEHKVFVEGVVWNINSFDQWGVELGKMVAKKIEPALIDASAEAGLDTSTRRLLAYARNHLQ